MSDRLVTEDETEKTSSTDINDIDVEVMLKKSEVLKPEFIKQKVVEPYYTNKKKEKAKRKVS